MGQFQTDAPEFTPQREWELRQSVTLNALPGVLDERASEPVAGHVLKVYHPFRLGM